jgi:hypothetical protein
LIGRRGSDGTAKSIPAGVSSKVFLKKDAYRSEEHVKKLSFLFMTVQLDLRMGVPLVTLLAVFTP